MPILLWLLGIPIPLIILIIGYAKDQAAKEVNDWYGRQKW